MCLFVESTRLMMVICVCARALQIMPDFLAVPNYYYSHDPAANMCASALPNVAEQLNGLT